MGLLLRLLEKMGLAAEEEPQVERIHVSEIVDWLSVRVQEIVSVHALDRKVEHYLNSLKSRRWALECTLDEWEAHARVQGHVAARSFFAETRQLLELLTFPEKPTINTLLSIHSRLEPELERLCAKIEKSDFNTNFSFLLDREQASMVNPLLKELLDINAIRDQFEQDIIRSGFSKVTTLLQKAMSIEQYTSQLYRLRREETRRLERLKLVDAKQQEKEAAFKALQSNFHYPFLEKIQAQRTELLRQLENSDTIHQRFQLKQKIDDLEKQVGNKDFIRKADEVLYRLEHFTQQADRLRHSSRLLREEIEELQSLQRQEIEQFTLLAKGSLGREIEVKI